jgi:hypothetical protein
MTFCIQNQGLSALGGPGGGLGFGPDPYGDQSLHITKSVAVKFDIYQNWPDPSNNSTGLFTNGQVPLGGYDLRIAANRDVLFGRQLVDKILRHPCLDRGGAYQQCHTAGAGRSLASFLTPAPLVVLTVDLCCYYLHPRGIVSPFACFLFVPALAYRSVDGALTDTKIENVLR